MPQMSPMNWILLMIMFLITLILINIMLYFSKLKNINLYKIKNIKSFKKLW